MAALTGTFHSFSAAGNREDLVDKIYTISPVETPALRMFGKTKATNTNHQWQTDAFAAAAANAQFDGDEFTYSAPAATTPLANATQISYKTLRVSGTQNAMNPAGRNREMIYQLVKRNKELRRDQEFALTNNQTPVTAGSAGTGTARALRPMLSWYSTNVQAGTGGANGTTTTGRTDGTQRALDESLFKTALRTAWSAGGEPDVALVGPFNKQVISTFAGGVTKMQDTSNAEVVTNIDLYRHDFGVIKIIPDRFSRERDVHVLDMSYWRVATLRPIRTEDTAKIGDAENAAVITEFTLEAGNEAASALIADCTTN